MRGTAVRGEACWHYISAFKEGLFLVVASEEDERGIVDDIFFFLAIGESAVAARTHASATSGGEADVEGDISRGIRVPQRPVEAVDIGTGGEEEGEKEGEVFMGHGELGLRLGALSL